MNLTIRFSGGRRADFGAHDFEGIMTSSLRRFGHRLTHVNLYIEDINGPREGVDKQCRCVLHLRRLPPIVVQDHDESMFSLIHRVANRAAYALSQKTERSSRRPPRTRSRAGQNAAFAGRRELEVTETESATRGS